jgi:hypothetical protein
MYFITSNRDLIVNSDDDFDDSDSDNDDGAYDSDNDVVGGINAASPPIKITPSEDCDWMIW